MGIMLLHARFVEGTVLNVLRLTLKSFAFIASKLFTSVSAKTNVCPVRMNVSNANQVAAHYAKKVTILIHKIVSLARLDA